MKAKRNRIKNIILGVLAALAALAMALLPVLLRSSQTGEQDAASILTATVERGSIRTTISGGGALTGKPAKKVSVPHGVEITRYLVKNGQSVEVGQPLALVDKTTVMKTIATVQENLDYLDEKMSSTGATRTKDTLRSPVSGRVKALYMSPGDAVADVMQRHGALAVLSLDGYMAVQVETEETVYAGDSLRVTLSSGKIVPGRAERQQDNTLTVLLSDDGPALGELVTVSLSDGTVLGEGTLYVHNAWNLTAASGVIKTVYIKEGEQVGRSYGLVFIEEMDGTGRFDQLAAMRRDYEETLITLFELYENGAVTAQDAGIVAGVDEAKVGVMRAQQGGYSLVLLDDAPTPPPDPNNTPPSAMQNKSAVVSGVTFGSVSYLTSPGYIGVGSYSEATEPDYATVTPFTMVSFAGVKVFAFNESSGAWDECSPAALNIGQIVYLAYDGANVLQWVLIPIQPVPEFPEISDGGGGPAPVFEMYDLSETEIMRLAPSGDMTVQVKIDEMDILSVAPGQEAEITVDALPGRTFIGRVSEINPQGANSGGRTRYTVTITVDQVEELLAGMNVNAILTVGDTEDILTIPAAALSEKGSRTLVYTACDPQTNTLLLPVEVETGISDGKRVEIVSGLQEGQEIFYTYYETTAIPELAALPGQFL